MDVRTAVRRGAVSTVWLWLICIALAWGAEPAPSPLAYPETVRTAEGTLRVHHPVIDRWDELARVEAWVPVEVTPKGSERTWIGAVRARARTSVDMERRLVTLSHQEVLKVQFSSADAPPAARDLAARAISAKPRAVLLDDVLHVLAENAKPFVPGAATNLFNQRPPRIVVSQTPQQLMSIDGQPLRAPIEGTRLEVVVNTDWDLFYDGVSKSWWVINQGSWQTHSMLATGGWKTSTAIPADFERLESGTDWPEVARALPPRRPDREPAGFTVTLEATELLQLDGAPVLKAIPGAGALQEVANTQSQLFHMPDAWYVLLSGRWFKAASLDGNWQFVEQLPAEFGRIPSTHPRAVVRASVPGTREATQAMLEVLLPRAREVAAAASPDEPARYTGPPVFQEIGQTGVARAVNTPQAVLRHNNTYYLCQDAAWYLSSKATGPWRVARAVPDAIFTIPPSDPLHYVTYVQPVQGQGNTGAVNFTWTGGYEGQYATGTSVVIGTGWSYSPWIGTGASPAYWGHPWSYGWNYRPGSYYHHPWYWYGAWPYNESITLTGPERGLANSAVVPSEEDPAKPRRGYDYAELGAQPVRPAAGEELYAGQDGQVYKRTDQGWAQAEGDDWSTMAELEQRYGVSSPQAGAPQNVQRQAYKQNAEDEARLERYYDQRSKNQNMYGTVYMHH